MRLTEIPAFIDPGIAFRIVFMDVYGVSLNTIYTRVRDRAMVDGVLNAMKPYIAECKAQTTESERAQALSLVYEAMIERHREEYGE